GEAGELELHSLKAGKDFSFAAATADAGITAAFTGIGATVTAASAATVKDVEVDSVEGAQKALQIVDKALNSVNASRADMGAIQNRFTSTIANLNTTSENLSASRSRIRDTDYAKETAELTRTQFLQQAGTAMLAKDNCSSQNKQSDRVHGVRADMIAHLMHCNSSLTNLITAAKNLSSSRSRIRDTDYDKETAELTRTQILQQAGTAMLAKANSSTQNVLSLLG